MARELGLNPKNFGSLATEKQQPWKLPLGEFIGDCYFKRFKRERPEQVRTLEQVVEADEARRKVKHERNAEMVEMPIVTSSHSVDGMP